MSTWEQRMSERATRRERLRLAEARTEPAEVSAWPTPIPITTTEGQYLADAAREWVEHGGPYHSIPCACMGPPPGVDTTRCRCALSREAARWAGVEIVEWGG